MSLLRALTRNRARTHPEASDPRLRGRRYELPYDRVWRAARELAESLPRWRVVDTDPGHGRIRAEARTRVLGFVDDVEILLSLGPDGETRVDLASASRVGRADLGTNARRIGRYLRALDQRLGAGPG